MSRYIVEQGTVYRGQLAYFKEDGVFDLRKIFDLSKFFAVPKNFLKSKIYCTPSVDFMDGPHAASFNHTRSRWAENRPS